jgi:hypothetical protein
MFAKIRLLAPLTRLASCVHNKMKNKNTILLEQFQNTLEKNHRNRNIINTPNTHIYDPNTHIQGHN